MARSPAEWVRKRVVIVGQVQGVFFRDSCRHQAEIRGVRGWVRNRSDGAVEAAFEGNSGAVAALVGWCRTGPERAVVERVDVFEEELGGEVTFRIR